MIHPITSGKVPLTWRGPPNLSCWHFIRNWITTYASNPLIPEGNEMPGEKTGSDKSRGVQHKGAGEMGAAEGRSLTGWCELRRTRASDGP